MNSGSLRRVPAADTRIVYGARCTWWDSIYKVGHAPSTGSAFNPNGIPCCPHCGSMLFEMESEAQWWEGVERYEANGHPGYRTKMQWARGKCFSSMAALDLAYVEKVAGDLDRSENP